MRSHGRMLTSLKRGEVGQSGIAYGLMDGLSKVDTVLVAHALLISHFLIQITRSMCNRRVGIRLTLTGLRHTSTAQAEQQRKRQSRITRVETKVGIGAPADIERREEYEF